MTRYCNQVLDKDIDDCATTLLQDLVRFQDRMYHKDPTKVTLAHLKYLKAFMANDIIWHPSSVSLMSPILF